MSPSAGIWRLRDLGSFGGNVLVSSLLVAAFHLTPERLLAPLRRHSASLDRSTCHAGMCDHAQHPLVSDNRRIF